MHNELTLIGYLGADPKLHTHPDKKTFATFSVATHRRTRDAAGQIQDTPTWHHLVAWEKAAEDICRLLAKGSFLWARGPVEYRDWKDRQGVQHRTAEVHVAEWRRLDRGPAAASAGEDPETSRTETAAPPGDAEPAPRERGRRRPRSR
jgi:single-strand DNA-binding protein